MTRSAAKRQNGNARRIAAAFTVRDVAALIGKHGAFTAETARRFAPAANVYPFIEMPKEVNWPLCAELLNRKLQSQLVLTALPVEKLWNLRKSIEQIEAKP